MINPLKIISLAFILFYTTICTAQPFKVIKASKQNWAGGVVGRTGINCHIELATSIKAISPDTVWINGYFYPIDSSGNNSNFKSTFDSVSHKTIYFISVGEVHDRLHRYADTTSVVNPKLIRHFKGAAMISYTEKHRQHFSIVQSFAVLKQLDYP